MGEHFDEQSFKTQSIVRCLARDGKYVVCSGRTPWPYEKFTQRPWITARPNFTTIRLERAGKVIEWIEKYLVVPNGILKGKKFKLTASQKAFIIDLFSLHSANEFGEEVLATKEAVLTMARKNAKTTLIAAIGLACLIGPEREEGDIIDTFAVSRDQAGIMYRTIKLIIYASPELRNLVDAKLILFVDYLKKIQFEITQGVLMSKSADANTNHGANPRIILYDEIGQALNSNLYEVLSTSQGAQKEGLFLNFSTRGDNLLNPLEVLLQTAEKFDDKGEFTNGLLVHGYTLPQDADIWFEENWILGNPSLGEIRPIGEMRRFAEMSKINPSKAVTFRKLYLNMYGNNIARAFSFADWEDNVGDDYTEQEIDELFRLNDVYGGLDLAAVDDVAALVWICEFFCKRKNKTRYVVRCKAFVPSEKYIEKGTSNGAPYEEWVDIGALITTPGPVVDRAFIAATIADDVEKFNNWRGVWYDRYLISDVIAAFSKLDLPLDKLFPYPQTFPYMGVAIKFAEERFIEKSVMHGRHPVLTWMAENCMYLIDKDGRRRPSRANSKSKIDCVVAMLIAFGGIVTQKGTVPKIVNQGTLQIKPEDLK